MNLHESAIMWSPREVEFSFSVLIDTIPDLFFFFFPSINSLKPSQINNAAQRAVQMKMKRTEQPLHPYMHARAVSDQCRTF